MAGLKISLFVWIRCRFSHGIVRVKSLKQLLKQQCYFRGKNSKFIWNYKIHPFVEIWFAFLVFLRNDTKYIRASESFHPPLNVYRREKERKRENGNRKARRSWFEKIGKEREEKRRKTQRDSSKRICFRYAVTSWRWKW